MEFMKRIQITVAYDGTRYSGWQIQKNGITVEEVLNGALSKLLAEPIQVIGASRTDAGVHAMGNVAVFDTDTRIPAEKICYAVNGLLPEDIRVIDSAEAAPNFHPRKTNSRKTYEYRIWNSRFEMPFYRFISYHVHIPLDVEKMRKAAAYLVGEHDFASFCSSGSHVEDTIRTIYQLSIDKDGDMIVIRVTGNGFLYNMVRIIAGTLIEVGNGRFRPEEAGEMLRARDRSKAGRKVPARGLCLRELVFLKEPEAYIHSCNEEWEYELWQGEIKETKRARLLLRRCADQDYEVLLDKLMRTCRQNGALSVAVTEQGRERTVLL